MIEVKRTDNSITIKGHAHYAEPGKDIVCAGVSTLAQTLIYSLSEMTSDDILYDVWNGSVEIKHGTLSEEAQLLVKSFFIGFKLIADEYPNHVKLV